MEDTIEMVPCHTVKEYISFVAKCRCDHNSFVEIDVAIDKILEDLGIFEIRDTWLTGVSGGERKLARIAIELLVNKEIMILDEPTTGLDSHRAFEVVEILKEHAMRHNRIIIMTLHHPGAGLFELIDHLLFVIKGVFVYDGPVSSIDQYLADHNFKITNNLSKPEFLFELFSEEAHFDEIRQYGHDVKSFVEHKLSKSDDSIRDCPVECANDFRAQVPFKARHVFILLARATVVGLRKPLNLLLLLNLVLGVLVTLAALIFKSQNVIFHLKSLEFMDNNGPWKDFRALGSIVKTKFPELAPIIFNLLIVQCFLFSLVFSTIQSPIYQSINFIKFEMKHGMYSVMANTWCRIITEFILDTIRTLLIIPLFLIFGIGEGLGIGSTVLYLFVSSYLVKLSFILFLPLMNNTILHSMINFLRFSLMCLNAMYKVKDPMLNSFVPSSVSSLGLFIFGFIFWNNYFLDQFIDVKINQAVKDVLENSPEKADYLLALEKMFKISPNNVIISPEKIPCRILGFEYPCNMNLLFLLLSVICTIFVANYLFKYMLAPNVRTRLSKKLQ